jgi:5-methylcytosine-specific restriction enzyme subunit McrC
MLALLFDMNSLWEEYILARLKHSEKDVTVYGQQSTTFWNNISIRPDIVIESGTNNFIIDTKWKNINGSKPSTEDLRQMYVYNDYWKSDKAMLLYPSNNTDFSGFVEFEENSSKDYQHKCGLGKVSIFNTDGKTLNGAIGDDIINWFTKQ